MSRWNTEIKKTKSLPWGAQRVVGGDVCTQIIIVPGGKCFGEMCVMVPEQVRETRGPGCWVWTLDLAGAEWELTGRGEGRKYLS